MAGLLLVPGAWPVFDAAGDPVSGATISFFQPGTTTPKPVYSDDSLTTSLGSVLTTNAAGEPITLGAVIAREWWASSGQVYDIRIQATGLDRSWNGIPAGSEGGGGSDDVPLITSVAVLRTTVWSPTRPDVIQLAYNHIPGDGGGFFRWDSANVQNDNNGGTRVKEDATLTGRWVRQVNDGWVHASWFGLVLSSNESDASANTTALQRALNSGFNVRLPSGRFVAGLVTQNTPGQIVEGDQRAIWTHSATASGNLITLNSGAVGAIHRGYTIDGNSAAVTYLYDGSEILNFATDVTVEGMKFLNCQSMGIRSIGPAHRFKCLNNFFENVGDFAIFCFLSPLTLAGSPADGIVDGNTIINFGIQGGGGGITSSVGIGIRSLVGGWKCTNNSITQTTNHANEQLGIEFWSDSNNGIIANNTVDMSLAGDFGLSCTGKGNLVSNNLIIGSVSYAIEMFDRASVTSGNIIRSPYGAGIALNTNPANPDSCDLITITGNTIENVTTTNPSFAGIVMAGDASATPIGVTVTGNTLEGPGNLLYFDGGPRAWAITGNSFYNTGSAQTAITMGASEGIISGNLFHRVSAAGTGNQTESVLIGATSTGITVTDNRWIGNSRIERALSIQSGASNIFVGPNHFSGITLNSILVSSSSPSIVIFGGFSNTGISANAATKVFGFLNSADNIFQSQNAMPGVSTYTVANLPTNVQANQIAYASNGRKNGEGSGAGTGVLVFRDGSAWRACDTGATVAS
jgi:hypothetical protein